MAARQVARLTTLLTLTTAQQSQATTIFTNDATAVSALTTSMKTARSALETAIQSGDTGAITTQATEIGSLTTQEVEDRANAQVAFYAILTPDQQTKYKQLAPGGPGGFGKPGGPDGPGGPPR
jgi:Spy/CpxP family protein refolding chaperone